MKLVIKAYLSKEKFFALPSDEQRKRAKNSEVYKKYLKEGKKAAEPKTKVGKDLRKLEREIKRDYGGKASGQAKRRKKFLEKTAKRAEKTNNSLVVKPGTTKSDVQKEIKRTYEAEKILTTKEAKANNLAKRRQLERLLKTM